VAKKLAFTLIIGGFVVAAVALTASYMRGPAGPEVDTSLGFSALPDGRGGTNYESIAYTKEMGFDKKRSLQAFESTVYPLIR
jgi:hypothetical protein